MDKISEYIARKKLDIERTREEIRNLRGGDVEAIDKNYRSISESRLKITKAEGIACNLCGVKNLSPLDNRLNSHRPDCQEDSVFIKLGLLIHGSGANYPNSEFVGNFERAMKIGLAKVSSRRPFYGVEVDGVQYKPSLEIMRRAASLREKMIFRQMNEAEYSEVAEKDIESLILTWDPNFARRLEIIKRKKVA
ncbi:MAG: hypothetical protein AABW79_02130 [Nanoarchaeota archaeon]